MEYSVAVSFETAWFLAVKIGAVEMLKLVVIFTGFVTWKEFHVHFLLAKGYKQNDTLQHVEDYESLSIEPEGEHLLSVTFAAICAVFSVPEDALYYKLHCLCFSFNFRKFSCCREISGRMDATINHLWIVLNFYAKLNLPLLTAVSIGVGSVFTTICLFVCLLAGKIVNGLTWTVGNK